MQSVPRLEIKNLTRRFGDMDVVRDVSLSVMPGQVTCLLGPSGCGKSTTLRMIAGIDQQNSGEIWVDGKLICDTYNSVPPEERSIGLMFQDFALFPHLSVAENVAFGLRGSKAQKRARVVELLEKVGLAHMIDDFPHTLSGGEQQRRNGHPRRDARYLWACDGAGFCHLGAVGLWRHGHCDRAEHARRLCWHHGQP